MNARTVFAIYSAVLVTIGGGIGTYIVSERTNKIEARLKAEMEDRLEDGFRKIQTQLSERTSDRIIDDAIIRMKVAQAFETALDNHYEKVLVKREEV